jgi:hypothetical protein
MQPTVVVPGIVSIPAERWRVLPREGMPSGRVLSSDIPGAALEYDFEGAAVSADMIAGAKSGMFSVSIDNKFIQIIDLFKNRIDEGSIRVLLANNPSYGKHKLRIEVLKSSRPEVLGSLLAVGKIYASSVP